MKIINNKIYVVQGETPTYTASVIDKDTGAPYIVLKTHMTPVVEFIVRPSIYNRADDYVYKAYLLMNNVHQFDTDEIIEYNQPIWEDAPLSSDAGKLHRRTLNGVSDFAYWNGSKWIPYEFEVSFYFDYDAMKKLEAKTYKYDITLYYGNLKETYVDGENPVEIVVKKPLLEATDFIVGGSLSE